MIRLLLPLCLLFPVAVQAQPATAEARYEQTLAIALSVQNQILDCWTLPPGYENKSVSVRLAFFGDGVLDGDPALEADSTLTARRYPELMRSIADAIETCLPFEGLDTLGANPTERFDITVHFQT